MRCVHPNFLCLVSHCCSSTDVLLQSVPDHARSRPTFAWMQRMNLGIECDAEHSSHPIATRQQGTILCLLACAGLLFIGYKWIHNYTVVSLHGMVQNSNRLQNDASAHFTQYLAPKTLLWKLCESFGSDHWSSQHTASHREKEQVCRIGLQI